LKAKVTMTPATADEPHVAVAPGVGFGEEAEGFVCIALVENEQRLRQAARGIKRMISAA
jgi:alanine-synthesizing transaminase